VAVTLGIADQTAQSGKILKERPTLELLLYLRRYLCGPRGVSSELRLIVSEPRRTVEGVATSNEWHRLVSRRGGGHQESKLSETDVSGSSATWIPSKPARAPSSWAARGIVGALGGFL
jgi:hypothetical protein